MKHITQSYRIIGDKIFQLLVNFCLNSVEHVLIIAFSFEELVNLNDSFFEFCSKFSVFFISGNLSRISGNSIIHEILLIFFLSILIGPKVIKFLNSLLYLVSIVFDYLVEIANAKH